MGLGQSSAPDPTNSIANGKANSTACKAACKGASVHFAHLPNRYDGHGTKDQADNGNGYRFKAT